MHEFGFIKKYTPTEEERKSGKHIKYHILTPPKQVTKVHVEYAQSQGWTPSRSDWSYEPICEWFIKETDDESEQVYDEKKFSLSEYSDSKPIFSDLVGDFIGEKHASRFDDAPDNENGVYNDTHDAGDNGSSSASDLPPQTSFELEISNSKSNGNTVSDSTTRRLEQIKKQNAIAEKV